MATNPYAAPQAAFTQVQGIGTQQANQLGQQAGSDIYELQRRRLAALGQGQQRNLARFYAGRGGRASSSAAAASTQQLQAERSALADASLQAQLSGRQIGMAEAQRLAQQNQFAAQLQQSTELANLQSRFGIQQQTLQGRQQMAQLRMQLAAQRDAQRRKSRGGLFGSLGSALGSIFGGPIGGALGGLLGNSGGGGGGSYSYSPYVNNPIYGQDPAYYGE